MTPWGGLLEWTTMSGTKPNLRLVEPPQAAREAPLEVTATRWVEHLASHVEVAHRGHDPEGVHQVRVACRRLLVFVRVGGWRVYADDLRWLRSAAGTARDLDVLLAHDELPSRLAEWMQGERRVAYDRVRTVLEQPRTAGLIEGLGWLPPVPPKRFVRRIEKVSKQVVKRGDQLERHGGDLERYHKMRRTLRKLRYAREWLGDKPKPLKRLQDDFGVLNDTAVMVRWLDASPLARSLSAHRQELMHRLAARRRRALSSWRLARRRVGEVLKGS